jgi:hypothetical protein
MKYSWIFVLISSIFSVTASAQTLSDATLSGRYILRHIQFSANYLDAITDARSIRRPRQRRRLRPNAEKVSLSRESRGRDAQTICLDDQK